MTIACQCEKSTCNQLKRWYLALYKEVDNDIIRMCTIACQTYRSEIKPQSMQQFFYEYGDVWLNTTDSELFCEGQLFVLHYNYRSRTEIRRLRKWIAESQLRVKYFSNERAHNHDELINNRLMLNECVSDLSFPLSVL